MSGQKKGGMLGFLWETQKQVILTTLSIIGVVVVLIYGLYTYREQQIRKHLFEANVDEVIPDSSAEERVFSIALHFDCIVCDTCKNMPLTRCECKSGKAERNYIRREIVSNSSDSVVVRDVASLFGGLKELRYKK